MQKNSGDIMKNVIGFRSNKLWKKIIACIFYAFFLLGAIVSAATLNFSSAFLYTFLISLPFAAFYGIDFIRKRNDWKPALISAAVCVAMTAGIGLTYVPPTAEALAAREAAQLQKQEEKEATRLERDAKKQEEKAQKEAEKIARAEQKETEKTAKEAAQLQKQEERVAAEITEATKPQTEIDRTAVEIIAEGIGITNAKANNILSALTDVGLDTDEISAVSSTGNGYTSGGGYKITIEHGRHLTMNLNGDGTIFDIWLHRPNDPAQQRLLYTELLDDNGNVTEVTRYKISDYEISRESQYAAKEAGEAIIKDNYLNYPDTAKFPMYEWTVSKNQGRVTFRSSVTAQNAFGVKSTYDFSITWDDNQGEYDVISIIFDGKLVYSKQ